MLGLLAAGRRRALRKWILVVCAAALASGPGQALARYASIVVDANTGRVLDARDADSLHYPASLTKMMTLYLLFEQIEAGRVSLEDRMPVSVHASVQAPTKLGLRPGQTLRVRDAILGLVTKSANDAAVVIAEYLGGSESGFATLMTRKAHALGMSRTVFQNASGLPNFDQVTTARDMARLGIALNEHFPNYYGVFSTRAFVFNGRVHANHNHLLGRIAGVDGIKTGYTHASGFNLVSSVRRDGRHLVAAVLGGPTARARDAHMAALIATYLPEASAHRALAMVVPRPGRGEAAALQMAEAQPAQTQVLPAPQPRPVSALVEPTAQPSSVVAEAFAKLGYPKTTAEVRPARMRAEAAQGDGESSRPIRESAPASRDSSPASRDGWAIQIGAVDSEAAARDLLSAARNEAPHALRGLDPVTEKVVKGGQTLYRARFAGFEDKGDAQAACSALKQKDYACFAIHD